jgi:hypothetical protein
MTKFRDGFMMKSPLPKHQKEFYDEAERLSKESGTPGDYDRDNPEVREQLDKAEEAEKSHKNDGPIKMATASYRRTPMDTETYYGGEIDVPDITSVGKLAGYGIDSAVGAIFGGKGGAEKMRAKSDEIRNKLGSSNKTDSSGEDCPPGCK